MKAASKSVESCLFQEVIKGVDKLYKDKPKICAKLKDVFRFFELFEKEKFGTLEGFVKKGKPFKLCDAGFKPTACDGEIMITPCASANKVAVYLNDQKICSKIGGCVYPISFKIYVNLGDKFPVEEFRFPG